MTAAVPEPSDQPADWLYNEASGVLYGPDPDHPGLRYPVATDVQPAFGHLIAGTMNRAAEVEARVKAAATQARIEELLERADVFDAIGEAPAVGRLLRARAAALTSPAPAPRAER